MDQGGVRMVGLQGRRGHMAPRLGDTPADPEGMAGAQLLGRKNLVPPEKVVVVGRDSVRQLTCRSARACPPAVVLTRAHLDAVRHAAHEVSEDAQLQKVEEAQQAALEILRDREERQHHHQQMEARHRRRRHQEEMRRLEDESSGKMPNQDKKEESGTSHQENLEGEEEVKAMRKLVLAAKCHAIREAQIIEKRHISKLEKEEEERQVRIMEEARINGLKKEEEREMRRREVNFLAAQALNKQIEEQQVLREHKFIEKRKEAERLTREAEKFKMEKDLEERKGKQKKREEGEEVRKMRLQAEIRKEEMLKNNKLQDVRMMVEIKEKEKKEQERIQQELAVKKVKEDLQMMWLRDQERQLEKQKHREEIKKIQEQEKLEREWRQKELREATSKALRDAEVSRERRQQVEDRRKARMAAALKRKEEMLRVTDHWMITEERERLQEEHAKQSKVNYESRIRAQIEDQEARRAKETEKLHQEKEEEDLKMKMKQAALTKLKLNTIQELRKMALPEKLIEDLEKKT
uniref:Cilia- and flagella-associated protein 45 n=1 Tax=Scylla olivacea TaxID=85551 RepID=A0A0P4W6Q3_SCYOL